MSMLMKADSLSETEIQNMNNEARALLATKHYTKLGQSGIFAIISMAKAIGINPVQCLNGGMYPINGKVEMDGKLMMRLIRDQGHSVTKDKKSDSSIAIMHGKRKDNGDTWTESFSIEDAKKAGLLGKGSWNKFAKDMLQWRALSRLARYLFADVIQGCYVKYELSEAPPIDEPVDMEEQEKEAVKIRGEKIEITGEKEKIPSVQRISKQEAEELDKLIGEDDEYRTTLINFIKKGYDGEKLEHLPAQVLDRVIIQVNKNIEMREVA